MKNNKLVRDFKVDYNITWDNYVEIKKIKSDLSKLQKLGATHINFDIEEMYGDLILNVTATLKREETDDEYNTRLQNIIKVKNFKKIIKSLKL